MVKSFNLDRHWQDVGSQVTDLANQHLTNGICQRGELTQQLEQRIANATGKKVL